MCESDLLKIYRFAVDIKCSTEHTVCLNCKYAAYQSFPTLYSSVMTKYLYIRGFRARQHLRSLAPVMNDYDGQMIFEDLVGLKLPDICLTREQKPRKLIPTGDLTRARCVTGAHSTACSENLMYSQDKFSLNVSFKNMTTCKIIVHSL